MSCEPPSIRYKSERKYLAVQVSSQEDMDTRPLYHQFEFVSNSDQKGIHIMDTQSCNLIRSSSIFIEDIQKVETVPSSAVAQYFQHDMCANDASKGIIRLTIQKEGKLLYFNMDSHR